MKVLISIKTLIYVENIPRKLYKQEVKNLYRLSNLAKLLRLIVRGRYGIRS